MPEPHSIPCPRPVLPSTGPDALVCYAGLGHEPDHFSSLPMAELPAAPFAAAMPATVPRTAPPYLCQAALDPCRHIHRPTHPTHSSIPFPTLTLLFSLLSRVALYHPRRVPHPPIHYLLQVPVLWDGPPGDNRSLPPAQSIPHLPFDAQRVLFARPRAHEGTQFHPAVSTQSPTPLDRQPRRHARGQVGLNDPWQSMDHLMDVV